MATEGHQIRETMVAGADLSTKLFTFVVQSGTGRGVVTAGNGAAAFGVLRNEPASGEAATVITFGRVPVLTGTGGLTAGQSVGSDANGLAVNAATGDVVLGKCVDGASAGGYATIDFFRAGNVT